MTLASDLIAFTLAASLLTITPGLDTALVLRTIAASGPGQAFKAACGVALGCFAWGLIVAAGLGALLAASHLAYEALRWVGALYLFYLGGKLILSPRREGIELRDARMPVAPRVWLRGFLTNILNPKVGIFYVSFLPQFIPPHASVPVMIVALAAIHVVLGIAWFGLLIAAARSLLPLLQKPRVVAAMDRLTGFVFLGFGLKLAFSARV
ncbi:LysE family translocator [Acidisoma cellulosilytica]|uniref:LysE family translocator n=1 Tax=Acidisoma cellulosilyticum TaxID=2802395 RepID=A0A964E261_9PROT|nr:LysE family translocator [Acidisoma cellulosilyticum]MCB8878954.1 LysE family translocator [Acidisoma cellulosilyticum]